MTSNELKEAIRQLKEDDPEFLIDLVGNIVTSHLVIKEQKRDFYEGMNAPIKPKLIWETSYGSNEFSYLS